MMVFVVRRKMYIAEYMSAVRIQLNQPFTLDLLNIFRGANNLLLKNKNSKEMTCFAFIVVGKS